MAMSIFESETEANATPNFEVFELSATGERERLLARLSVFEDARAIAEVSKSKPRVVLHFGQIVWPKL
jgi:hypothetical protein